MATIFYNTDIRIDINDIIEKIPTKNIVAELYIRRELKYDNDARNAIEKLLSEHYSQQCRCVQDKFDSSSTAALNVLQDLLGMQHTTSKEQVIEQLKNIL
jgi:hypothetical protein